MACTNLWLFILALSAISCQAGIYLPNDSGSDASMTFENDPRKTIRGCDSRNVTSVTPSTFDSDMDTGISSKWLTTTTMEPTHCATPSSSNSYHGPRKTEPVARHCMPPFVPIRSLANGTLEDLVSSLIPGLIVAFPNHTMVVQFHQVGLAPGLHSRTITTANNSTSSSTTNVLRHLPMLAFIAQGLFLAVRCRANPAVAVARPGPVARPI
ncbi:hypothetical protein BDV97DRAFT_372182 [Delphinella strobiligena]|nr:hypothetical protein BDV97DRAFT_372182 [Delphinella strobiligena]